MIHKTYFPNESNFKQEKICVFYTRVYIKDFWKKFDESQMQS